MGKKVRNVTKNLQHQVGELASILEEIFRGAKHVKSFNAEIGIPVSNINDESLAFKFYYGPNSSQILKKYHKRLKKR